MDASSISKAYEDRRTQLGNAEEDSEGCPLCLRVSRLCEPGVLGPELTRSMYESFGPPFPLW